MDSLVGFVQELSKVRNISEIINIVRMAARKATNADGATFVLKDGGYCFYADEDAIGPLWKGKYFPLNACVSGWAMLNKQIVAIPDIFTDYRVPIEAYEPTFVKSLAMMPVRQSDPVAAIGIYWAERHEATECELNILQAIADTTSVAIENVQLLSSLGERVRELEIANRVKDEFLMLVSHELRTPLNSVLGWSEMLSDRDVDPSLYVVGMEAINRNSKNQCRVIDRLLDASQIVLGKFIVQKKKINLLPLIHDVISKQQALADKRNIKIIFNSAIEDVVVNADQIRLSQVVEILVDNAVKFSTDGSSVIVTLTQDGPGLMLKVRDFGLGVEKELQPKLFDRFSQTEKYMSRSYGGLGLGLTIAKNIVQSHQGQIRVQSQGTGQGAEFSFTIPFEEIFVRKNAPSMISPLQT